MTFSGLRRGAVGVLAFLGAAEAAGRTGLIDPDVLPPASTLFGRAILLVADGEFWLDVLATLTAWCVGLLLAVAVAVPLGMLIATVTVADVVTRPYVEFLRPIPSVALVPLAILVFPGDLDVKVAVIVYAASWPLLINTVYGLREVDPMAKETLRSFGFGSKAVLWRASVPSALPFIATGLRLASAISLILAVSAEMLKGSGDGIGTFVAEAGSSPDAIEWIVAATIWTGIIGLLLNTAFVRVERRLFRWQTARGTP